MALHEIHNGGFSKNQTSDCPVLVTGVNTNILRRAINNKYTILPPADHLSGFGFSPRINFNSSSGTGGAMLRKMFSAGVNGWDTVEEFSVMQFPLGSYKHTLFIKNDIEVTDGTTPLVVEIWLANGVEDGGGAVTVDPNPANWIPANLSPTVDLSVEEVITAVHDYTIPTTGGATITEDWTVGYPFVIFKAASVPVWGDSCSNMKVKFELC